MDVNRNLEALRQRALCHFPQGPTSFVSRTIARIPVFFISLAAMLTEAILGLKSVLFKAEPMEKGQVKPEATAKTNLISMKIFALLWHIPDQSLVNAAKLASITSKLDGVKQGDIIEMKSDMRKFLGLSDFQPADMIVTTENAISSFKSAKSSHTTASLLKASKNEETKPAQDYLESLYFNVDSLKNKRLSAAEISRLKVFLDNNFQGTLFNLEFIKDIKDESIRELFYKVIEDHVGSIDEITTHLEEKVEALKLYIDYKKAKKLDQKGLSIEYIEDFEKEASRSRASSTDSSSTPRSTDSLDSSGSLATLDRTKVLILRQVLKETLLFQLARESKGKEIGLKMPGINHPGFSTAKFYQNVDCLNNSQRQFDNRAELYNLQFFDLINKKLTELNPGQDYDNFKKTLAILFASTQAYDADMITYSLFPKINSSLKYSASQEGLTGTIERQGQRDTAFIDRVMPDRKRERYEFTIGKENPPLKPESCEIIFEDGDFLLQGNLTRTATYMHDSENRLRKSDNSIYESDDDRIEVPFTLKTLTKVTDDRIYSVIDSEGVSFSRVKIDSQFI